LNAPLVDFGGVDSATGLDVVAVLVALALLTTAGVVDHPGLGAYRAREARAVA
jgi:hypothetical protein